MLYSLDSLKYRLRRRCISQKMFYVRVEVDDLSFLSDQQTIDLGVNFSE